MIPGLTIFVTVLDQLTKWLVCAYFDSHDFITVIPGLFDLRKVYNHGAAWGILSGQRVILVAVSVLMLALMWFSRHEIKKSDKAGLIGTGLLIGGIIGNLIDRVKLGYVVDFLDFHWGEYVFPTFNVADSAIFIGVILFAFSQVIHNRKPA